MQILGGSVLWVAHRPLLLPYGWPRWISRHSPATEPLVHRSQHSEVPSPAKGSFVLGSGAVCAEFISPKRRRTLVAQRSLVSSVCPTHSVAPSTAITCFTSSWVFLSLPEVTVLWVIQEGHLSPLSLETPWTWSFAASYTLLGFAKLRKKQA